MNKLILLIITFFVINTLHAQVGINTQDPQAELDVNGSIQIRGGVLKLGASADGGESGQILVSGGADSPATWTTLDLSVIEPGEFYLDQSYAVLDKVGIQLDELSSGATQDVYDENLSNWVTLDGLESTIVIDPLDPSNPTVATANKVSFVVQSLVQLDNPTADSNNWTSFGLGIFVDGKLKAVRTGSVKGVIKNSFIIFNVGGVVDNLSAGEHKIQVAARVRNTVGYYDLYLGTLAPGATNISPFMAESSIKVNVYLKLVE